MDDDHTCWRQVPGGLVFDGFAKYEAFNPKTAEQHQLSVGHSSKIGAFDCYFQCTVVLNLKSVGVAQFPSKAIQEANEAMAVAAALWDDSMLPDRPDWHCYVDFAPMLSRQLRKDYAQKLWLAARDAG